jgi:hypothetical protein
MQQKLQNILKAPTLPILAAKYLTGLKIMLNIELNQRTYKLQNQSRD